MDGSPNDLGDKLPLSRAWMVLEFVSAKYQKLN